MCVRLAFPASGPPALISVMAPNQVQPMLTHIQSDKYFFNGCDSCFRNFYEENICGHYEEYTSTAISLVILRIDGLLDFTSSVIAHTFPCNQRKSPRASKHVERLSASLFHHDYLREAAHVPK
jgi:hypothetical protein